MSRIFRIVGPPGCGKTREIAHQSARAAAKHGNESVVVCSLTRAAAREAASRVDLPDGNVGTLHALAFHALGCPKIVGRGLLTQWNETHADDEQIDADWFGGVEDTVADDRFAGESMLARLDLQRALAVPYESWPEQLQEFSDKWKLFKEAHNVVDFTDLIEQAIERIPFPPRNAQSLFVDEAQDLSRLELNLIERWSAHTDTTVLVGDPWQALYSFRGASADIMAPPYAKVLRQSYRVPRTVQTFALSIIQATGVPLDFEYDARDEEGVISHLKRDFTDSDTIANRIEESIGEGRSVMFLATCSYMLNPVCAELRKRGLPYANPYSPGRWSPLEPSTGISIAERFFALLACSRQHLGDDATEYWSSRQVKRFLPLLKGSSCTDGSSCLERGSKIAADRFLLDNDGEYQAAADFCRRYMIKDTETKLLHGDIDFIRAYIAPSAQSTVEYLIEAARHLGGFSALRAWLRANRMERHPRIIVGTVHSVKGGEVDDVILAPDLSKKAWHSYIVPGWYGHDAVLRTFYVAATRARRSLTVLDPQGKFACKEVL